MRLSILITSVVSVCTQDTARFARIYNWFKDVALASARKREAVIQKIFTVSLRLAGKGISNKQKP